MPLGKLKQRGATGSAKGASPSQAYPLTPLASRPSSLTPLTEKTAACEAAFGVRPEGACHLWRKVPSRQLSINLEADERLDRVTGRVEAS